MYTPCKSNRPKERAKIVDDFDHCVIKRTIHGLYSRKIVPTVSIMHKEIKYSIKITKSKLTLTLIDLEYSMLCIITFAEMGIYVLYGAAIKNMDSTVT
jgi:hypothetical protein